jgi:site-specific DNA-cytosine methylase
VLGSLFSGIGGLELGLEWAGLGPASWQVELDGTCRSVLARWWPEASREVVDVTKASAANLERVDVICGGFPCQDVSSAGLRKGLDGERSGLWREFARIVRELGPRWVIVENVASGAKDWMPHVRHDLRVIGYRSAAVELSAADVGAPHGRARIFVVAHRDSDGREGERQPVQGRGHDGQQWHEPNGCRDSDPRTRGRVDRGASMGRGAYGLPGLVDRWPSGRGEQQYEWEPARAVRRTKGGSDGARLKALGNAVVPACAYVIGRLIVDGRVHEVLT